MRRAIREIVWEGQRFEWTEREPEYNRPQRSRGIGGNNGPGAETRDSSGGRRSLLKFTPRKILCRGRSNQSKGDTDR